VAAEPANPPARARALERLADRPLVALTGAGLSTDSGIPDYRGPSTPRRTPMTRQEFDSGPPARRHYWARSHVGWARMGHARPNAGHRALAEIDPELLITQNVDGLHRSAGSRRVVELHGRISEVICLGCDEVTSRETLQGRLVEANPGHLARYADADLRPDGDVELAAATDYDVPDCVSCGGVLKPHVVLFGENVPAQRVARCYAAVEALATRGALLVAGSSLTVMSGLRFVRRAAECGTPVVIVNRGPTRGDDLATYVVNDGCSKFLTDLAYVRRQDAPHAHARDAAHRWIQAKQRRRSGPR
jgi:NAD-dependent SIR2 family protein deacetylase